MNSTHNHIIEKVFVEINTKDSEIAFSVKNNVSEFLKDILIPQIERLFEEMFSGEQILRIGKMEISSVSRQILFNESVAKDVVGKIETALKDISESNSQRIRTGDVFITDKQLLAKDLNSEQIFLNFIQTGLLPWHAGNFKFEEFLDSELWNKLLANSGFVEKVGQILGGDASCIERFVKQIPFKNVVSFFIVLKPDLKIFLADIQLIHEKLPVKSKFMFLTAMIKHLFVIKTGENWASKAESFFSSVKSGIQGNHEELNLKLLSLADSGENAEENGKNEKVENLEKLSDRVDWKESKGILNKNDEQHIQNAGLILLHPFLKNFFINTRIAGPTGRIEVENQDLAVQALHFIAAGQESAFENDLVFEKFLCGLPAHHPIIRESLLNEEIKSEAEEMLTQVINIWSVLKSTSIQSFRESFIHRNGILTKEEKGYSLIVEARSWDILLEKLPWNYTVINWYLIDKLLFVEWHYEGI